VHYADGVDRGQLLDHLATRLSGGGGSRGQAALCGTSLTCSSQPTVVRGEMARHWLENPQTRQQVVQRIPLGRVAEPVDVVGATLFFCSPAAAFVTGQVLYVDGGLTATQ
jgi:gluconate 5-dehydrogenase